MTSSSRWRLTAPDELRWVQWEDEWLLYDGGSGDTHLLQPLAAEVLQALQHAPTTVAALVEGFVRDGDEELHGRLSGYIDSLITTLARLGVIEPA
jgi:PqqD family protein of HPr-rel-A system